MLNGLVYDGANSQEIIRKIEKTYGMALFFYNVKKTVTYKSIFEDAIKVFSDLFGNEIENGSSLENLLGNVTFDRSTELVPIERRFISREENK